MKKNEKVIILSGGFSEESEISKITSLAIAKALSNRQYNVQLLDPADFSSYSDLVNAIKKIDPLIVFNGLHGAEGEDGRIQSLLSLEKILFTGSDYRASAISMDKYISGLLASSLGIPVPKRIIIKNITEINSIINSIKFPVVIKPNDSGSSVGISIIKKINDVEKAIEKAFNYSDKVLMEEFVAGRELTVTILGGKPLPVVEIKPNDGWYDYTNKYTKGNTSYEVPAKITEEETKEIQEKALQIYKLFGCKVYARVDFRFEESKFHFLEVNTLPGMTLLSLTPMAAKEEGYDFEELLEKIIKLSLKKEF
ncbi:MAG: D-alanine--D-alanine ligase [Candidatus Cloacimonetes bacterium]|nr:D-alanine--D-alanine ligase [Candidatus Cloacimonadota bacterium]